MNVAAQDKASPPAQEDYGWHKAQKAMRNGDGRGKDCKVHGVRGAIGLAEHQAEDIRFNDAEVEGYSGQVIANSK